MDDRRPAAIARGGGMEEEGPGFKYPKPLAPGDNFNRYLRAP